jgi:hypothetical protein
VPHGRPALATATGWTNTTVEGQHLTGYPIAHPGPAVMPPRRLAHLDHTSEQFGHSHIDVSRLGFSSVKPPLSARTT